MNDSRSTSALDGRRSDLDLASRLHRQGGLGGKAASLPQLVATARTPLAGAAGAPIRRAPHSGNAHVLVPHTNYRPITLPPLKEQVASLIERQAAARAQQRTIGTRNASVPADLVGTHNVPTDRKAIPDHLSEDLAPASAANAGGQGSDQEPVVDPADPSWISPADFVEFILNHDSLTEEFCYMSRSGPYEFEIVPFSKINPNDYMTISIRGVTHYSNGELDYQDLSEWQRDQEMYRKIVQIPFFEKYQRWKLFTVWKSAMRNQAVQKCSRTLNANLFALDPTLCESLLRARNHCVRISMWNLLELSNVTTYTLNEFEEAQRQKRTHVVQDLQHIWTQIKDELLQSCKVSLQLFLKANGFGQQQKGYPAEPEDTTGGLASMSYTERATTRTQCRKLTKFIRVVQYLFNDAIARMVQNSTQRLLETLEGFAAGLQHQMQLPIADGEGSAAPQQDGAGEGTAKPPTKKPNFSIECLLIRDELKFEPLGSSIMESLDTSLREAIRAISGMQAFLHVDDFLIFTKPLAELGDVLQVEEQPSDLYGMVTQDPSFKEQMHKIGSMYDHLYDHVVQYAGQYTSLVQVYKENQKMVDPKVTFADASLEDFRNALAKYRQQTEDINRIERSKDIGLFRLESKQLQETLLPSPVRCNQLLATYIPQLAMQKNGELTKEIQASIEKLSQYPKNVDEYVEFNLHVTTIDSNMQHVEGRFEEVQTMTEIIREFWRIDNDTRKAFGDLAAAMKQLVVLVGAGKERVESDVQHFSKALEQDIPELHNRVNDQLKSLEAPDFNEVTKMSGEGRKEVLQLIDGIEREVKKASEDAARYNRYQDVLKVDQTAFDNVDELKAAFASTAKLWRGMDTWDELVVNWNDMAFGSVEIEPIQRKVQEYNKTAVQSAKGMPESKVPKIWGEKVMQFKNTLPVVAALRNKALKQRHWDRITELIGQELDLEDDEFTLGKLLDMGVDRHMEEIQDVSSKATAELALEEMLDKVKKTWESMDLIVNPYKEQKDVFILGSLEDVTVALEDSLVTVSTIAGSRFVGPIRDEVESWQKNLMLFQETLDEWLNVQKNWMYLESIFGAGDIRRQLPTESAKFLEIDTQWRAIMKETHEYSVAIVAATKPGRRDIFKNAAEVLDQIQKSLEDYLLSKCIAFPRFFFLSSDELLEILSQARNPKAVQPHLRKCFDNLIKIRFGDNGKSNDILAMFSGEGEEIPLFKPLKARGNVEKWLSADGGLEDFMVKTVKEVIKKGWKDYAEMRDQRKEWVRLQYCQVCITVGSIYWTLDTEEVLTAENINRVQGMGRWYNKNKQQLQGLTELIREKLSKLQRKSVVALVTQDVHNRDIIETLYLEKVVNIQNFKWQQQLRYYWDVDLDDCVIRQVDALIMYGYEYQGALSRLVITPLTDRCWMTITGALHIQLGASPAGPAGTGKTESTKDLAKGLARQCVVFNCSDQIEYKMMGKLYSGVVSAGAWTCLDEFNRISIEVLSVVAQQVLEIRQALLQKLTEFIFEDRLLKVKNTCGIFITMNPGYAGRTELPDNLKVLFRPVAMMVPDYTLIAEIMLFAEGFSTAKLLSGKFTKLYKLSSEQLSKQDHYDFGMRAVKSVLVMAGALKREDPDMDENVLLIRAMRDSNVPKFLTDDLPIFFAIINDLFPGVEVPYIDYGALRLEIERALERQELQLQPKLVVKTIQLFETFNVRFGVMLVGPTLGGKTTDYKTLAMALTQLRESGHPDEKYQKVIYKTFNPKAISMGELYGEYNELTQEWSDGLGSRIMRGYAGEESLDYKWTIFDGPVDAIWIESMNTVLDDNMTLCLANSERVKFNWTMRMLFEVADLAVASPATVSRCGMVYMTASDLGWEPLVYRWLKHLPEEPFNAKVKDMIQNNFDAHVQKGIDWLRRNGSEPVKTEDTQLVVALCNLFVAILNDEAATAHGCVSKDAQGETPLKPKDLKAMDPAEFEKLVTPAFCWAFSWSIGGSCDARTRRLLEREIENWFPTVSMPRGGGAFDGFLNFHEGPKMKNWSELVPKFVFDETLSYFHLLVPNTESIRTAYTIDKMLSSQASLFLTGGSGVGKSVIIANVLEAMKEHARVMPVYMTFSAQTKAFQTQLTIEGKLEKKRKTLLGAPVNKTVVILVDDVNMPLVEQYGAQPPIELLRQFQDQRGFYDRKKHEWKDIESTTLLLCAAPPGGGRNEMTARFTRHSMVLCMPPTSEEAMTTIFSFILTGFLHKFKSEVQTFVTPAVSSTIEIYNKCSDELLPTPTRPHYTFNLRDLSKVFQGLLMVKPMHVPNPEAFTRLWYHELCRVFCDRLICKEDKQWFYKGASEQLRARFRTGEIDLDVWNDVMWCDFLRPGADARVYEEAKDKNKVLKLMEDYNDDYNLSHTAQMNLVFFKDCLEHISRISRIFRQPRGNMVLVGVGGSGRSSCARLCACMAEAAEFEIALAKGYNIDAFREDEKKFLISAGGAEARTTMFLLSDTQIIDQTFLEDLNNILNAGEVPNLFPNDEMDRVIGDVRPFAKEAGRSEAKDAVWAFFVERLRDNLHIVLTMSPVGSALRLRLLMFPALVNCCTIDWFLPWPDEALLGVAAKQLSAMHDLEDDKRDALAGVCCHVHQEVVRAAGVFYEQLRRQVYVTPKSYLDLISLYMDMMLEKQAELKLSLQRLQTGVNKIDEANGVVNSLQEDLTKLAPFIAQKIQEASELVPVVTEEQNKAEAVQEKVAADEVVVRKQADDVKVIADDAQKELDVAMPALESALKALDALDKRDIQEMKSFPNPPPLVIMTMGAVNTLLNEKTDWDTAKKVLNDARFLERLKVFDKDNIPQKTLKSLEQYVQKPQYSPDAVGKQSNAAKSLCMWTHAMDTYSKVAKEVEPKRQRLAEMNAKLDAANQELAEKQAALREVQAQVETLQRRLKATNDEKESLENEAALTKARLARADILTVGLADEGVRWRGIVEKIRDDMINLTGDVFLSAACISYYGPFTGTYRAEIVDSWVRATKEAKIPCGVDFDLKSVMGNPVEIRDWNLQGLPTDSVSINNGVMVVRGRRWPLMIDPQAQGNKWIRKKEGKDLKVLKMSNTKLLLILENCIRMGSPLLMEDLGETLDPALEPVLLKAVYDNNGRLQIRVGDNEVDYDRNFLFYMTTKMPNPHYFPEVCIKVTVINFTVTFEGLEEQLLNETVSKEIPTVLGRRTELMLQLAEDNKTLKMLEDTILRLLSESSGNILDDEVLINTLGESKQTSQVVNKRVKEAEVTAKEIEAACAEYTPVATAGSIFYFVIAELANINPMYQFSLFYFVRLFNKCITAAEASSEINIRLKNIENSIISNIFVNVCRGLFEDDKLTLSFLIATSFQRHNGEINSAEWSLLLRGVGILDMSQRPPNPEPDFFTEKAWDFIYAISVHCKDRCPDICTEIAENVDEWKEWAGQESPHLTPLPGNYEEDSVVHYFQVLLLLRALCPEKVIFGVQEHTRRSMGENFIIFAAPTMAEVYGDSTNSTPVVFVLTTGADPTNMLLRFADTMGTSSTLGVISLGQGQGPKAQRMIDEAKAKGSWVLLQNCHLCKSWMPSLERICEAFEDDTEMHPNFRLFLTSMPADYFPVPILQNGVKMTNEPPKGLRANILRSLGSMDNAQLETSQKPEEWRKLQFSLKFFHGIIQERRKFGPLGWNKRYEFNDSDLETSTQVLHNMLEMDGKIPWDTLVFVIGHINYGGRVTDDWDRRCLITILELYMTPDVLEDDYEYAPGGNYKVPVTATTVTDFKKACEAFPLTEQPEVFGMHENANISFMQQETDKLLGVVLSIQPRESGGGSGRSAEDIVAEIAADQTARLPHKLSDENAHPNVFAIAQETGLMNSLGTGLSQEMSKFNHLLKRMTSTLADLQRAIKGLIVMTSDLDSMFNALLNNQIPGIWESARYPCLKPLSSFYDDMLLRFEFFREWVEKDQPISFWISAFYFPQGFLTSVLQAHSRSKMIPVDQLGFEYGMEDTDDPKEIENSAEQGILVHGLFLDGASWDFREGIISDQEFGVIHVKAPVMNFIPMQDKVANPDKYNCPLYKTSVREGTLLTTGHSTNFVLAIEVDTARPPSYWILKGAALLTMLND